MSRIPKDHSKKNRAIFDLLQEKIAHYENVASALLRQPTALSPKQKSSDTTLSDNLSLSHLSIQSARIGSNVKRVFTMVR